MSATADLSPTVVNLKAARGDTWRLLFTFYEANPDGTPDTTSPVDLSGATYSAQLRHRDTGALFCTATVDDLEAAAGQLALVVAYDDTTDAPLGKSLAYDLQQDTGTERHTLVSGTVRVVADWTE